MYEEEKNGKQTSSFYSETNLRNILISLIVFVSVLIVWWRFSTTYKKSLLEERVLSIESRLHIMGSSLSSIINQRQGLLKSLESFVRLYPVDELRNQKFYDFARGLEADDPIIRVIQFFPKEGNVLIYPVEGNESIANSTLEDLINTDREVVRKDVQRALDSHQITLSDPYELRQGGFGVVARKDVFQGEEFLGLMAVVLNMDSLLTIPGIYPIPDDLRMAIRDTNGHTFYGDDAVFLEDPILHSMTLPEGKWTIAAIPRDGWEKDIRTPMVGFWVSGFVLALLAGAVTFLIGNRNTILNKLVQLRNAELSESKNWLMLAGEAANIGFFSHNAKTDAVEFSADWKRQIGYEEHEIVDRVDEWESRIHPDDRKEVIARTNDCLRGAKPDYEITYRLLHKDGSYRWVLSRGLVENDSQGFPLRLIGCHVDITNQKQSEEAIRSNERRFRGLAESSQDAITLYDFQGSVVYENPAANKELGIHKILKDPKNQIDDKNATIQRWEADILSVFKSGVSKQHQFEIRVGDKPMNLDARLYPVFAESGKVELVLGITRDVTDIKKAERKLSLQIDELQRWQTATMGREHRILDLKKEINQLRENAGLPIKYKINMEGDQDE